MQIPDGSSGLNCVHLLFSLSGGNMKKRFLLSLLILTGCASERPASVADPAGPLFPFPTTSRVSVSSSGSQGDNDSADPSVSYTGRWVAFGSRASNLVPNDTNGRSTSSCATGRTA
jgi:hypothetical protein